MDDNFGEGVAKADSVIPAWLKFMLYFVAGCAVFMLIKYLLTFGVQTSSKQEVWGQFGDFFGGILNPLLSSLTLAAVLVTMRLQSRELKVAQQENKRATQHLEKQAEYIRIQNFESVFFRLLDVHLNSRLTISFGSSQGKHALDQMAIRTYRGIARLNIALNSQSGDSPDLSEVQEVLKRDLGDELSVYCRSIYQVLKFVDVYEGFLNENEGPAISAPQELDGKLKQRREEDKAYRPSYFKKRQYVSMLRAQLSKSELQLLFLSCLGAEAGGLKYLVEKYSIFKGFSPANVSSDRIGRIYSHLAFADYEDINIKDVRLLEAHYQRANLSVRRSVARRYKSVLKNKPRTGVFVK